MRRGSLAVAALAFLSLACASGGTPDPTGALVSREADVISRGEISNAKGLNTAWDAVQRLRPRFLRNPGRNSFGGSGDNRALVRVDDTEAGPPEALQSVDIQFVLEIRYYSAVDATSRFGGTTGRGKIHVITKSRG